MKVLFFSEMTISPGSGGGNTVFNLLEPCPADSEVFYATPNTYPTYWTPFPEISSHICSFSVGKILPTLDRGKRFRIVRRANNVISRIDRRLRRDKIIKQIMNYINQLQIDVLILCPQSKMIDVDAKLVEYSGIPTVLWLMDNYYTDQLSLYYMRKIWTGSQRRFVISEAMQKYFSEFYGGYSEVLNNSVIFPETYTEPLNQSDGRLHIIYAGSIHSYYMDSMSAVLKEIDGLGDQLVLDIYTPDKPPISDQHNVNYYPSIPSKELLGHLQKYDILLLISNFDPEYQEIAKTSLASKIADYLSSGRCILVYGPEYSENVRYTQRYGFGEVVTSQIPGDLRTAILSLMGNPKRRQELGKRAYYFGKERHNKSVNSIRIWQALLESLEVKR